MIPGILLITTILLISLWNGLVIRWYSTRAAKWNRLWHSVGLAIRILIIIIVYLTAGWIWCLAALFACSIFYNIIINLIIGKKWYYIGNTSAVDKWLRKNLNISIFTS